MNFKLKAVVASVLAVATVGTAQATIKGAQNGSEMVLSLFRDNASPANIVIDTGIDMDELVDNPNAFDGYTIGNGSGFNVNDGGAISQFLATAPIADFVFNGAASNIQGGGGRPISIISTFGVFDSTSVAQSASGMNTAAENVKTAIQVWNNNYGTGTAADQEIYTDAGDGLGIEPTDFGFHDSFQWGDRVGGAFGGNNNSEGAMDVPLDTYYFYLVEGDVPTGVTTWQKLGTWMLNSSAGTATFNASVVPIPAAVWLLGSALVGLVGVSRRRQAVLSA